jgi:protein-S-isoprenylcysteine O-methyltransferase Ste14
VALGLAIVLAGVGGPGWPGAATSARIVVGIGIGIVGASLFIAGVVGLGSSLTPFPKPSKHSTLRVGGAYRLVRHPIYGGVMLVVLGWSLASSPLALLATALAALLLELKSRREESLLSVRYPQYEAYRRRVRWRFVPGVH